MSGRLRRAAGAVGLGWAGLVIGVATIGCGVSTSDQPEPIGRENVPADLLDNGAVTDEEVESEPGTGELVHVWFLISDGEDNWLQAVERTVPWPAGNDRAFGALFGSPSTEERESGLYTAIPPDAHLTRVPAKDGSVLELSLSEDFYAQGGSGSIEAFAQLVYTATELDNVQGVQFLLDGEPIQVLDGEGQSIDGPVGRSDYDNLAQPAP